MALLLQHFIWLGPGQSGFGLDEPAQSDAQRQLPSAPKLHLGLMQHLMLAGSAGHAPVMVVPPDLEQDASVVQTPAWLLGA